jgi:uncharacterized membrane protein
VNSFFEWLQMTGLAVKVSEVWFPWVESLHVIALALVVGTLFIIDSRLIGLTSRHLRFTYVSEQLLPWTWGAFIVAATTGILLFMSNAQGYVSNTPFLIKMGLLVLAGLNMLYFQLVTYRSVASWDAGRPIPAARVAGIVSLTLWILIIGFGRWIGFV